MTEVAFMGTNISQSGLKLLSLLLLSTICTVFTFKKQ